MTGPTPVPLKKREPIMVDLSPTWQGVLGLLLTTYENGTPEGRALALGELIRMAKLADEAAAKHKLPEQKGG